MNISLSPHIFNPLISPSWKRIATPQMGSIHSIQTAFGTQDKQGHERKISYLVAQKETHYFRPATEYKNGKEVNLGWGWNCISVVLDPSLAAILGVNPRQEIIVQQANYRVLNQVPDMSDLPIVFVPHTRFLFLRKLFGTDLGRISLDFERLPAFLAEYGIEIPEAAKHRHHHQ